MAQCKQCGREYEAKRSTSSYCGPKCKQAFYRNRMNNDNVTPVTVSSNKSVTVTEQCEPFLLTVEQIDSLPLGVVKPRYKPDQIWDGSWQSSRGYMLTIKKLVTYTVAELESMKIWIPSWKYKAEGYFDVDKKHVDRAEDAAGLVPVLVERNV